MRKKNTFLFATGFLMIGQLSFAAEEMEKLQQDVASARKQVYKLEAPVFKNLREVGVVLDCLSLRDGKRFASIEDATKEQLKEAGLRIVEDDAGQVVSNAASRDA